MQSSCETTSDRCLSGTQAEQFLERYFDAWSSFDPSLLYSFFAGDASYVSISGEILQGHLAILDRLLFLQEHGFRLITRETTMTFPVAGAVIAVSRCDVGQHGKPMQMNCISSLTAVRLADGSWRIANQQTSPATQPLPGWRGLLRRNVFTRKG